MRTLLILPAVTIPLALVAVLVTARRLTDAARGLTAEVEAMSEVSGQIDALRHDLDQLLSTPVLMRRARTAAPRQ